MLTAAPALLALDHVCLAGGEGWATRAGRLLLATMGWDPIYKVPMGAGIQSHITVFSYQNYL